MNNTLEPEFKDRLATLLEEKNGGNQSALARAVTVSPQAVQSWLAGRTKPRDKQVDALAAYFDTTPAYLLYGQKPDQIEALQHSDEYYGVSRSLEEAENTIIKLIGQAIGSMSIKAFCEKIGLPEIAEQIENGEEDMSYFYHSPSQDLKDRIVAKLGLPENYWGDGLGMKTSNVESIRAIRTFEHYSELPDNEFVNIPVLDAKLSAGHGRDNPVIDFKRPLPFQTESIKANKIAPENALAMKVIGRSMEPILHDGDTVLIDQGDRAPTLHGGVFALTLEGEWMVKRVFKTLGGGVRIASDNPAEGLAIELTEEKAQNAELKIIGRVRYRSGFGCDF
ncbi:HTH-type transcriptional regulator PrtR [Ephemeroptericola cinctiostellae]|uniref:HTH-type transcriptional regulator PrtR n=1 Tax=Ephemeroptericola cinctiostellae TaxID=2268024 RepID=A0A345DE78_9BURK|nr:LexA family transcriptional regulator [Ephemeroptericola cinctiostellae]AXF86666.1 HTH-type transcriptional regulator PrtR [Ephemeroptericola cinctiostellae]